MQEKDVSANDYLEDEARVADLLNVVLFQGNQMLQAENIQEINRSISARGKQGTNSMSMVLFRDLARKVQMAMKVLLVAVENQSEIDYAMVIRVMLGNGFRYYRQWKKLAKVHAEQKDLKGAEFLSGLAATDRLIPEMTLVLYWGEEPWNGPRSLKELLDLSGLPKEVCDMVQDYRIYVLEVRRFQDYDKFKTDLRQVFGFLQRTSDMNALKTYVQQEREVFGELSEDAFELLRAFAGTNKVKVMKKVLDQKGEESMSKNMCKALDDLYNAGKAEGREEAREEVIKVLVETMQELEIPMENVVAKLQVKFSLDKRKALKYAKEFWV